MKKTLLTIAVASLTAASSQAQGFVVFGSSTQNVSTNNVTGGSVISDPALGSAAAGRTQGAGLYYYALFYSTSQTAINGSAAAQQGNAAEALLGGLAGWSFSGDYGISTGTAGRWTSVGANADGTSTVAGLLGGATAQFAILGWSASLGTTLAALQASITAGSHGYLGQSIVSGTLQAGDGNLVLPGAISSAGAPGIQGFTLGAISVPEPGTLALAALGGASLLMFRRKK
jgi:hypothetical protein